MKFTSKQFSFRNGEGKDVLLLEDCRVKSIQNCKIYSKKQIEVWENSKPNWQKLIPNTIVCVKDQLIVGFVVCTTKFLEYLYVHPCYQEQGIGNQLFSLVEKPNLRCDCNLYSERLLLKRGWRFLSKNTKERLGESYHNKWYIFD
jgi:GNAT superfamily N-acetyltransferase